MLETAWGKKALEGFAFAQIFTNRARGKEYVDFLEKHFNFIGIPQYVVINPQGQITAWENDVTYYLGNPPGGTATSEGRERFIQFVETAKKPGESFTFESGFFPPKAGSSPQHKPVDNAPAKTSSAGERGSSASATGSASAPASTHVDPPAGATGTVTAPATNAAVASDSVRVTEGKPGAVRVSTEGWIMNPDLKDILETARLTKQPVLLDFTAQQ